MVGSGVFVLGRKTYETGGYGMLPGCVYAFANVEEREEDASRRVPSRVNDFLGRRALQAVGEVSYIHVPFKSAGGDQLSRPQTAKAPSFGGDPWLAAYLQIAQQRVNRLAFNAMQQFWPEEEDGGLGIYMKFPVHVRAAALLDGLQSLPEMLRERIQSFELDLAGGNTENMFAPAFLLGEREVEGGGLWGKAFFPAGEKRLFWSPEGIAGEGGRGPVLIARGHEAEAMRVSAEELTARWKELSGDFPFAELTLAFNAFVPLARAHKEVGLASRMVPFGKDPLKEILALPEVLKTTASRPEAPTSKKRKKDGPTN